MRWCCTTIFSHRFGRLLWALHSKQLSSVVCVGFIIIRGSVWYSKQLIANVVYLNRGYKSEVTSPGRERFMQVIKRYFLLFVMKKKNNITFCCVCARTDNFEKKGRDRYDSPGDGTNPKSVWIIRNIFVYNKNKVICGFLFLKFHAKIIKFYDMINAQHTLRDIAKNNSLFMCKLLIMGSVATICYSYVFIKVH